MEPVKLQSPGTHASLSPPASPGLPEWQDQDRGRSSYSLCNWHTLSLLTKVGTGNKKATNTMAMTYRKHKQEATRAVNLRDNFCEYHRTII